MNWELIYIISIFAVIPVFFVAIYSQYKVQSAFDKCKKIAASCGLTGAQLAEKILAAGNCDVRVERCGGRLSDHYDSKRKVVALSNEVHDGTSVAALGIAAHEVGHALQDEQNYIPLRIRNVVIPISNFVSKYILPFIIVSIILSFFFTFGASYGFMYYIILGFVILYGMTAIVQLITLPTEFNASSRAVKLLKEGNFIEGKQEEQAVKSVLNSAALTYVAALATTLVYLLRFVAILGMIRRD